MLGDIVVDTNVFAHASNPSVTYFAASLSFIAMLQSCLTAICVDPVFAMDPRTSSKIAAEYLDQLTPGTVGYEVVVTLAASGRVKHVPLKVAKAAHKFIMLAIPANARDRTFIKVTLNSDERVLVSHDYVDFPYSVRRKLSKRLGIAVLEAVAAETRL